MASSSAVSVSVSVETGTCCRHADKVRWIWEGLHDPCVDCLIVCGPSASGKSVAVAEALRGAQTRGNSWHNHNEVLLWNRGDVPCRVPLPGRPAALPSFPFTGDRRDRPRTTESTTTATAENDSEGSDDLGGARGLIVLRTEDDTRDHLARALRTELGDERCRTVRFVPDPDA